MLEIISKDHCSGCFACYSSCPKQCISMIPDSEGFSYPEIDTSQCIDCGLCEKVCPIINPPSTNNEEPSAFAAMNKNDSIRLQSSSGGIFSLLAETVINNSGIVFAAALSKDCKAVNHVAAENLSELDLLRGSKYVQSLIGDTYKLAKNALESGRTVLFSGTPCQIAGLYKYCKKTYENLYTCDFICHGVPSPMIWKKYVEYREEKASSKAQKAFFRYKKYSWKRFSLQFIFMNCTEYQQILSKDLYMRGFLSNVYLRPSCYNCSFKGLNRAADITLADFWGIDNIAPQMNDNKGTSLIIVHSEKGKQLFESVNGSMLLQQVDLKESVKYNSAAEKSAVHTRKRDAFFSDSAILPFSKLLTKYCAATPMEKIKKAAGRILRKLKNYRRV